MSAVRPMVTMTPPAVATAGAAKFAAPAQQSFGFADILDIVNPLQHIPVVSTFYRRLTGDQMSPTAEIAGGALFGGLLGAVTSIADVLWTQATGKDFGNSVMAWLGFDGKDSKIQFAKTQTPAAPAQQLAIAEVPPVSDLHIGTAPLPGPARADPDMPALIQAMEKQGVELDVALRAAAAYRNAIGLTVLAAPSATPKF
jgi:hypothetical protein